MMKQKRLTYVDLSSGEAIHTPYEHALQDAGSQLGKTYPLYINGEEVRSGSEFEVRTPFDTRILVGKFQVAGPDQIARAVRSAHEGFPAWESLGWKERTRIMRKTADRIEKDLYLLSAFVTYESGKNRYEAVAEVSEAVDLIRYHAGLMEENEGYVVKLKPDGPGASDISIMRPHGVFAVISPFNFPLSLAAGMAAGALICGNTIALKPTSAAPLSALKLYEAFIDSGVPPAAVSYLTGPGGPFGEAVVSNPDVDGIAFTGSRDAGMWLEREFTNRQAYKKPVISEMGSKNPVIVTASADLDKAVEGVLKSAFGYSGQKCSATSRVYVHESLAPGFIRELAKGVEGLVVGDPRARETFLGPVIDEKAVGNYRDAIALARKDGGRIVAGGEEFSGGSLAFGHFVRPTIVTGLPFDHPLGKKELFVPILVVFTFTTLGEALREANATEYGLTAGIFSEDREEVEFFFDRIRFGVTYANRRGGATTGAWPGSQSFGGWKGSGSTGKGIGGPYYLLSYLREQTRTRIGI